MNVIAKDEVQVVPAQGPLPPPAGDPGPGVHGLDSSRGEG